jgi:hypothetical protein
MSPRPSPPRPEEAHADPPSRSTGRPAPQAGREARRGAARTRAAARDRAWSWVVPLLIGLVGLAGIGWWTAVRAPEPEPSAELGPTSLLPTPVGGEFRAPIEAGEVVLEVTADVPPAPDGRSPDLDAVPAGASTVLTFRVPTAVRPPDGSPDVVAQLRPEPATASTGQAPHDHPDGTSSDHDHPVGTTDAQGPPTPEAEPTSLVAATTFLLNRAQGTLIVPNAGAAAGDTGHDDGHDHRDQPGQGLAQTIPGGGWAWAAKVTPEPTAVELDPTGRWLALLHADVGRVELVDLAQRAQAITLDVGAQPETLRFTPDGEQLWVGSSRTGLRVLDLAGREVIAQRPDLKTDRIVFDDTGVRALLADTRGSPRATLVAADGVRPLDTHALATPPVDAAFVADRAAFALVDGGTTATILPSTDDGFGRAEAMELGDDVSMLAIDRDGRTAVAVDRAGGSAAVVDLRTGEVSARAATAREPEQVVFLDGFALLRSPGSADLTWIDLADPDSSNLVPLDGQPPASLTLSADGTEVLAPSPADGRISRLHVMMGRPMVMEHEPDPNASDLALVGGGGVLEVETGVYQLRTSFDRPGTYAVTLRIAEENATFTVPVTGVDATAPTAEPEVPSLRTRVGETVTVRFLTDGADELAAPSVAAYATGPEGPRQLRAPAVHVGDGIYEAALTPRTAGTYTVWLHDEVSDLGRGSTSTMQLEVTARP